VPSTSEIRIPLEIEKTADVRIDIFDVSGNWVTTMAGGTYTMGIHNLRWNGENSQGAPVSSGIYFIRCLAGGRSDVKTAIVVR
jgi:flagellar hook assembly protein FlgD